MVISTLKARKIGDQALKNDQSRYEFIGKSSWGSTWKFEKDCLLWKYLFTCPDDLKHW